MIAALAVADPIDAYLRRLHPQHPQFEHLRQAMLAARGAKPQANPAHVRIPSGPQLKTGQDHADVVLLRQRLSVAVSPDGRDNVYDDALAEAVKAFQQQSGMKPTGIVNTATRNALNDALRPSGAESVHKLIVNMERWRWMPDQLGSFYVWDSVPEQMTKIYDQGKMVLAERIVVGKPDTPTPIFSASMLFVIFHPSWGVPPGMKANELLPQLQDAGWGFFGFGGASSVLEAHGLRVMRGGQPVNPNSITWNGRPSSNTSSCSRPARRTFSAWSNSASPTSTTSTCTIRRSGTCSAARSAPSATAACACRTQCGSRRCC